MIAVTDAAKNKHELTGRLERMVVLIVENASEIVKAPNTKITFDCAGSTVSATIQRALEIPRPES